VDPIVVNRVERFGGVEEEEVAFSVVFHTVEEEGVDVHDMVVAVATIKKALLGWVGEVKDGRGDGTGDSSG
jgi:hypothetical protein